MLRRPATLRDVARLAGVHPSTASRALNAGTRSMVSTDTVRLVLEAAEQLGYQPNSLARGLKMNRTFVVGMLIPDLTNPLVPRIVRGIEDVLVNAGYTLVLANTDDDHDKERSVVEAMILRRVDGLILATARRDYPLLEDLLRHGTPVVLINRTVDDPPVSAVISDDHAGVGLAVRHLAELGHRRIAHVGGPRTVSTGLVRHQNFVSWMQREGLDFDPELVVFADWFQEEPGAEVFGRLLDRTRDLTAVVTVNDLVALGCYDAAKKRHIAIPDELSVVGYNNIPFSDKFNPPLTTIGIPQHEIGERAAKLLLNAIEDPGAEPVSVRVAPSLVVRASTARISTVTDRSPTRS